MDEDKENNSSTFKRINICFFLFFFVKCSECDVHVHIIDTGFLYQRIGKSKAIINYIQDSTIQYFTCHLPILFVDTGY